MSPQNLAVSRGPDTVHIQVADLPEADTLVVVLPAMGTPAGYYRPLVAALHEHNLAVAVADLRGTGLSTPRAGRRARYGYVDLADDVTAVLDTLAPVRAGRRTLLLGHSLGGQVGLLHLARRPDPGVDGIALVACGLPYWRRYQRMRAGVLGFTQGISAVSALLGYWPGWGFGGRQARGVIRDWAYTGRHGRFRPGMHPEDALSSVTTPVLAVSVDHDQYTPPETTDHLVSMLTAAPVDRRHVGAADADGPLDHFRWTRSAAPLIAEHLDTWRAGLPARV